MSYKLFMAEDELKVAELRDNMADVLRQVAGGKRVLIRRYSGVTAALVPVSDYLALDRLDQQRRAHQPRGRNMQKIVLTNISGGEGKTTIARELAYQLHSLGHRVALMDTDPQASLTKSLGLHDEAGSPAFLPDHTILGVFQVEDAPRLPSPLQVAGVDIWPSNDHLLKADSEIASDLSRQGNLRDAVAELDYDYLIIDTKPGITPLLNAAVAAADHIVVPVSGEKGMENLQKLSRLIKAAEGFSPGIKVSLFVPNRQRNTVLSRAVLQDLQDYQRVAPISRPVRDSVTVGEAYRVRVPLIAYAPRAEVTTDFANVAEDLLTALAGA